MRFKPRHIWIIILLASLWLVYGCEADLCRCTTYLNGSVYSTFEYGRDANGCPVDYYRYTTGNDVWEEICE